MILLAILALTILVLAVYVLYIRIHFERMGLVRPLGAEYATRRERTAEWARSSATIAFGKLQLWFGAALEFVIQLGETLNMPDIKAQLEAVGLGRSFAIALMAIGILTILARLRTAKAGE